MTRTYKRGPYNRDVQLFVHESTYNACWPKLNGRYCRFINPCFDAKSAAIKIEKCGKIEKFAQALNEGLFSRGKSADVPTQGAETSPRDGEDAASTMGGGAERTSARETGPEAPRVLVRPSQPRRLVPRCPALLWDGTEKSSTCRLLAGRARTVSVNPINTVSRG